MASKLEINQIFPTNLSNSGIIIAYFIAYCLQPLLSDIIKFNGATNATTFLILLPHYYSMIIVGFLPTEKKLSECDWRKGILLSVIDIIIQALKKGGLLLAGSAVYAIVDSSSIIWTAIWSKIILKKDLSSQQWLSLIVITLGLSFKAAQLNFSKHDDEFIGVILILASSVLMGLLFVLNEKFMKDEKDPIEGPNLVCMMGVCCSTLLTIWTIAWTIPRFDHLILENIQNKNGNSKVIMFSFFVLFLSGWIHSGTYWYILKTIGAVSSGVIKGLKVSAVFLVSHFLFCELQPNQCLTIWTSLSASTCVIGVIAYNLATFKDTKYIDTTKGSKSETHPLLDEETHHSKIVPTIIPY